MAKQWRDTKYPKGAAPYYIRGVKFVDGVSEAEVSQSIAEFFEATGVVQEDVPGTEAPEGSSDPEETVKTVEETPEETLTNPEPKKPRTRKK